MPEISIIIPVYKAEAYLHRCLNSILTQTFTDFELILVDDGSPDNCGAICDEYGRRDRRIRVIHQQNQGQAAARNNAVEQAKGPWICFVDSDDVIHPQMLECLYQAAVQNGANISACSAVEQEKIPPNFSEKKESLFTKVMVDEMGLRKIRREFNYCYWVVWGKLIRKWIVAKLPLEEGRIYEDNAVVCRWLHEAKCIVYTPAEYYFYRKNNAGTTKGAFSLKKLDYMWALEEQIHFYEQLGYNEARDVIVALYLNNAACYAHRVRYELLDGTAADGIVADIQSMIDKYPLDTLPLNEDEKKAVNDAIHYRMAQLRRLPRVCRDILQQNGIKGLIARIKRRLGC